LVDRHDVGIVNDLEFSVDDPRSDDVLALLETHLSYSYEYSPPEHVHALDIEGLLDPAVTFFSARRAGELLGVGALKHLGDGHAEVKSMHTRESARRQGIGRAMLDHLLAVARERGYGRVSLETGTMEAYAPARAMYADAGFARCEPFGQYTDNPYSTCMSISLDQAPRRQAGHPYG
jgi:putative acetyltransferase